MVDTLGNVNAVAGAPSYNGRMLRQAGATAFAGATSSRPLGGRTGVRPGTSTTTVTATTTTWTCGAFAGLADVELANESGPYPFSFDAAATGAMTAASSSNPRVDIIYVQIDDPSEDASTVPAITRKYLAGAATATPVPPALPVARAFVIAQINVPIAGGGSPSVTWVAPYMVAAGAVLPVDTLAHLNTLTGHPGQHAHVFGDSANNGSYQWNGTAWAKSVMIGGTRGNQLNPLPLTTATDVPGSSFSLTLNAAMTGLLFAGCTMQINVATNAVLSIVMDGASIEGLEALNPAGAEIKAGLSTVIPLTLAAGTHTFKLQSAASVTGVAVASECYISAHLVPA